MCWLRSLSRTRQLLLCAVACLLGIPVFAILHNVFDGLGALIGEVAIVSQILTALSVASFVIALFVCPAGVGVLLLLALSSSLTKRGTPAQV